MHGVFGMGGHRHAIRLGVSNKMRWQFCTFYGRTFIFIIPAMRATKTKVAVDERCLHEMSLRARGIDTMAATSNHTKAFSIQGNLYTTVDRTTTKFYTHHPPRSTGR